MLDSSSGSARRRLRRCWRRRRAPPWSRPGAAGAAGGVQGVRAGVVDVQRLRGGDVGSGGLGVEQRGLLTLALGRTFGLGEQLGVAVGRTVGTVGLPARGRSRGHCPGVTLRVSRASGDASGRRGLGGFCGRARGASRGRCGGWHGARHLVEVELVLCRVEAAHRRRWRRCGVGPRSGLVGGVLAVGQSPSSPPGPRRHRVVLRLAGLPPRGAVDPPALDRATGPARGPARTARRARPAAP